LKAKQKHFSWFYKGGSIDFIKICCSTIGQIEIPTQRTGIIMNKEGSVASELLNGFISGILPPTLSRNQIRTNSV
jgi:hypothetical protein